MREESRKRIVHFNIGNSKIEFFGMKIIKYFYSDFIFNMINSNINIEYN